MSTTRQANSRVRVSVFGLGGNTTATQSSTIAPADAFTIGTTTTDHNNTTVATPTHYYFPDTTTAITLGRGNNPKIPVDVALAGSNLPSKAHLTIGVTTVAHPASPNASSSTTPPPTNTSSALASSLQFTVTDLGSANGTALRTVVLKGMDSAIEALRVVTADEAKEISRVLQAVKDEHAAAMSANPTLNSDAGVDDGATLAEADDDMPLNAGPYATPLRNGVFTSAVGAVTPNANPSVTTGRHISLDIATRLLSTVGGKQHSSSSDAEAGQPLYKNGTTAAGTASASSIISHIDAVKRLLRFEANTNAFIPPSRLPPHTATPFDAPSQAITIGKHDGIVIIVTDLLKENEEKALFAAAVNASVGITQAHQQHLILPDGSSSSSILTLPPAPSGSVQVSWADLSQMCHAVKELSLTVVDMYNRVNVLVDNNADLILKQRQLMSQLQQQHHSIVGVGGNSPIPPPSAMMGALPVGGSATPVEQSPANPYHQLKFVGAAVPPPLPNNTVHTINSTIASNNSTLATTIPAGSATPSAGRTMGGVHTIHGSSTATFLASASSHGDMNHAPNPHNPQALNEAATLVVNHTNADNHNSSSHQQYTNEGAAALLLGGSWVSGGGSATAKAAPPAATLVIGAADGSSNNGKAGSGHYNVSSVAPTLVIPEGGGGNTTNAHQNNYAANAVGKPNMMAPLPPTLDVNCSGNEVNINHHDDPFTGAFGGVIAPPTLICPNNNNVLPATCAVVASDDDDDAPTDDDEDYMAPPPHSSIMPSGDVPQHMITAAAATATRGAVPASDPPTEVDSDVDDANHHTTNTSAQAPVKIPTANAGQPSLNNNVEVPMPSNATIVGGGFPKAAAPNPYGGILAPSSLMNPQQDDDDAMMGINGITTTNGNPHNHHLLHGLGGGMVTSDGNSPSAAAAGRGGILGNNTAGGARGAVPPPEASSDDDSTDDDDAPPPPPAVQPQHNPLLSDFFRKATVPTDDIVIGSDDEDDEDDDKNAPPPPAVHKSGGGGGAANTQRGGGNILSQKAATGGGGNGVGRGSIAARGAVPTPTTVGGSDDDDDGAVLPPPPMPGKSNSGGKAAKRGRSPTATKGAASKDGDDDDEDADCVPPPPPQARGGVALTGRGVALTGRGGPTAAVVSASATTAPDNDEGDDDNKSNAISAASPPQARGSTSTNPPTTCTTTSPSKAVVAAQAGVFIPAALLKKAAGGASGANSTVASAVPSVETSMVGVPTTSSTAATTPAAVAPTTTPTPAVAAAPTTTTTSAKVWQYKTDLRKANKNDLAWTSYSDADSAIIEAAYLIYTAQTTAAGKKKAQTAPMNATYSVNFKEMIQYRNDDENRQRPIRQKP